jgi:hypothetical protein
VLDAGKLQPVTSPLHYLENFQDNKRANNLLVRELQLNNLL